MVRFIRFQKTRSVLSQDSPSFNILIFRNFICSIIVVSGLLFAQFDDIATQVKLSKQPVFDRIQGTDFMFSESEAYSNKYVEGAAIQFSCTDFPDSVTFRFLYPNQEWSGWEKVNISHEPFSDRFIAGHTSDAASSSIRCQFRIYSGLNDVSVIQIGIFVSQPELNLPPSQPKSLYPENIEKPHIVTRAQWEAKAPTHGYTNQPYFNQLTLHHAAGYSASNIQEGIIQMQAIQELHQDVRGWSDIGYHFVIDKGGNIYQGRPETVIGAHVGGHNTGNTGVSILGCYHPPAYMCNDQLQPESEESIVQLFGWICTHYSVEGNKLLGHRDYSNQSTSCPGNNIWDLLPDIRSRIADYINYNGYPVEYSVSQNFPNPFNSTTSIQIVNATSSHLDISIYNIAGQLVDILYHGDIDKGTSIFQWNTFDTKGKKLASGVYFYKVILDGIDIQDHEEYVKKMVLIN